MNGDSPRPIHFRGYDLDANAVLGVEPTAGHSTGSQACDWSYGFKIVLPGNSMLILMPPPPRYGYGGGPSREVYLAAAEKMRDEFLRKLWKVKPAGKTE